MKHRVQDSGTIRFGCTILIARFGSGRCPRGPARRPLDSIWNIPSMAFHIGPSRGYGAIARVFVSARGLSFVEELGELQLGEKERKKSE